jgi:hypothetical protein
VNACSDAPAPCAASDGTAGARSVRTGKVVPGAGLDSPVVLRDAGGYPFAVGTAGGQVVIQVAATAPRGTVRLGDGHVAGLALTLAEAAARARETRPAAPPSPGSAP